MVITENSQPHEYLEHAIDDKDGLIRDFKKIFERIEREKENAKNGKSWEESTKDTMIFIHNYRRDLKHIYVCCQHALEKQKKHEE